MGDRAKIIINEYSAIDLLKRDTLDLDKFYTADLKIFIKAAKKEIEKIEQEKELLKEELERYKRITFICDKAAMEMGVMDYTKKGSDK